MQLMVKSRNNFHFITLNSVELIPEGTSSTIKSTILCIWFDGMVYVLKCQTIIFCELINHNVWLEHTNKVMYKFKNTDETSTWDDFLLVAIKWNTIPLNWTFWKQWSGVWASPDSQIWTQGFRTIKDIQARFILLSPLVHCQLKIIVVQDSAGKLLNSNSTAFSYV